MHWNYFEYFEHWYWTWGSNRQLGTGNDNKGSPQGAIERWRELSSFSAIASHSNEFPSDNSNTIPVRPPLSIKVPTTPSTQSDTMATGCRNHSMGTHSVKHRAAEAEEESFVQEGRNYSQTDQHFVITCSRRLQLWCRPVPICWGCMGRGASPHFHLQKQQRRRISRRRRCESATH